MRGPRQGSVPAGTACTHTRGLSEAVSLEPCPPQGCLWLPLWHSGTQTHRLPDAGGSCLSRSHHVAGQLWLFRSLSSPGLKPAAGDTVVGLSSGNPASFLPQPCRRCLMTESAVWGQDHEAGRVRIPPEQDRQEAQVPGV